MSGRYSPGRSSGYPEPESFQHEQPQQQRGDWRAGGGSGGRSSPSRHRSPRRSRRGSTPPRGDGYASSVASDAGSSVRSLQGLRRRQQQQQQPQPQPQQQQQQQQRSGRSPARDDLRVRAAEWMAQEYPGQTAQQVAQQLSGGGSQPQGLRATTRGDRFAAARLAAAQPRVDRPHLAAAVPYTPSVASDTDDQLGAGAVAFQSTGLAARDTLAPSGGGARCAYCGVVVPLTELAHHMQTGCPARPPAVGVAGGSNHATLGASIPLTPQAYRARAMEEVTRWLEASGLSEHAARFAELGFDDLPYLLRGAHGEGLDQTEIRQLVADVGMDSADEQKFRDALRGGHAAVVDARGGAAGTAAAYGSTAAPRDGSGADAVPRWLEKLNLGQYAGRFVTNGYDSLDHILEKMSEAEIAQLIEDCVMPHGHAQRLRNAIRNGDHFELGRGAPTAATAAVARMFDQDEERDETLGTGKVHALRKQLDEASGQLTDLSSAWYGSDVLHAAPYCSTILLHHTALYKEAL